MKKDLQKQVSADWKFGLSAMIRWESWVDEVNWLQ